MPAGGELRVETAREAEHVVVRVIDNGPGIPPDIQTRFFEPFFTTKGVGDGTGLGLDIAQRIVRQHAGQINAESRPGRMTVSAGYGVRFEILPRSSDADRCLDRADYRKGFKP